MRLIASIPSKERAEEFSAFLKLQGIENSCDLQALKASDHCPLYAIWVFKEDDLYLAKQWLDDYLHNPQDERFFNACKKWEQKNTVRVREAPTVMKVPAVIKPKFCFFLLALMIAIYLSDAFYLLSHQEEGKLHYSPYRQYLFFDSPKAQEELFTLYYQNKLYEYNNLDELPLDLREKLMALKKYTTWQGYYQKLLQHLRPDIYGEGLFTDPPVLFEKIRSGQLWRLFTPCLLHANLLHVFFNLLWLLELGRQVETRVGSLRFVFFVLLAGVFSNLCQYLMSGPSFLGFSGVDSALFAFVWFRQKNYPWESYRLARQLLVMVMVFMGINILFSLISFVNSLWGVMDWQFGVANTAHFSGALVGLFLARLPFFTKREL